MLNKSLTVTESAVNVAFIVKDRRRKALNKRKK